MPDVRLHFDNAAAFADPHAWIWYPGSTAGALDVAAGGRDAWGPWFDVGLARPGFWFKFKDGAGVDARWETRERSAVVPAGADPELWALARSEFVYRVEPVPEEPGTAAAFLTGHGLAFDPQRPWAALGALPVNAGLTLFGLYHPTAARVSVTGSFNGWQPHG